MPNGTAEESRWAHAITVAAFGVWDLDLLLDAVHYSPQWKARLGFSTVDAPDHSAFWRCRVHPADIAPMLEGLQAHFDGESPTYQRQFRLRSNGSGYRTVMSRGRVVARDASGQPTRMIGTMVDVEGRPAYTATYGLAADEPPSAASAQRRLPLHATLTSGGADPRHGRHVAEQIDDLLHLAWRDALAAR